MIPTVAINTPLNVQQAASDNVLGDLVTVYPRSIKGLIPPLATIAGSLCCIGIFVFCLLPMTSQPLLFVPIPLCVGAVGAWQLIPLIRTWNLKVYLFQEGAIVEETGRSLVFPWSSTPISDRVKVIRDSNVGTSTSSVRYYLLESTNAKYSFYEIDINDVSKLVAIIKDKAQYVNVFPTFTE